jgi:hypothetical protein
MQMRTGYFMVATGSSGGRQVALGVMAASSWRGWAVTRMVAAIAAAMSKKPEMVASARE